MRVEEEGKEETQKEEINREIERNASKLETSTEGRNHVKQRERNSRGDSGRVAIFQKETEEIFRSYRVKFISLPLSLSLREKCTLMMQEGRETKRGKEMLVHRAKRVLQICQPWHGRARERARE